MVGRRRPLTKLDAFDFSTCCVLPPSSFTLCQLMAQNLTALCVCSSTFLLLVCPFVAVLI